MELEVDRNVLELLVLLPDVDDTNRTFYADVWQPQEIQHGLILDRLQQDLGRPPAEPHLGVSFRIKVLGALTQFRPVQAVARLLHFLTGASTERQAVLAYNLMNAGMVELGETAISMTVLTPSSSRSPVTSPSARCRRPSWCRAGGSSPGSSAWRGCSGNARTGSRGRTPRTPARPTWGAGRAGPRPRPGPEGYAREIGRVEGRLLWASRRGLEIPPYILRALRESIQLYRESGSPA